jgi:hypothetical protein
MLAGLLLSALSCAAQLQVGNNLKMNLNGVASFGYTGDYGNLTSSDHGLTPSGFATLNGSYYNPNFLSFSVAPYYSESRLNSNYQSISDSSGVTTSVGLFGGSHFPVGISYSKNYNSEGEFGIPGITGYTTHGNSDSLSVGWGVLLPNLPSLSLSFLEGNNAYSVYGASTGENHFDSFSAQSQYMLAGFNLHGSYHYGTNSSELPDILTNAVTGGSSSESQTFSFGVSHRLPFHGVMAANYSRSDATSDFDGITDKTTLDSVSASLGFSPIKRLNLGANTQYTDNLLGSLYEPIIAAGGTGQPVTPGQTTHSLDTTAFAAYNMPSLHLSLNANAERRDQTIFGGSVGSSSYSGGITWGNLFLGGYLNTSLNLAWVTVDTANEGRFGLNSTVNYSRKFQQWNLNGSVNYAQNTETLLIAYTTTSYGYTGGLGRKLGRRSSWNVSMGGAKSGLTSEAGTGSFSQSYSTSLSLNWLAFSGAYTRSSGNAIATGAGLTPTSVLTPVLLPSAVTLYGGRSLSFGASATPAKRFTLSASYANSLSNTGSGTTASNNTMNTLNALAQYQFRKMSFTGGYSRLLQGFSGEGTPPSTVSSFYFGVQRWFNFF